MMDEQPISKVIDQGTDDERTEWRLPSGVLHRKDGPAYVNDEGDKFWYQYGLLHREDGPAAVYADGTKEYWLNDKKYSEEDFDQITNSNSNNLSRNKM